MKSALLLTVLSVALLLTSSCANRQPSADATPPRPSPLSLGTYAQIAISVPDLDKSLPFYQKLGFKVVAREPRPYPALTLNDGIIHLRLEENPFPSPRLDYVYGSALDRDQHARQLEQLGIPLTRRQGLVEFTDPAGLHVALVVRRLPDPPLNQSFSAAGYFNGLAIPTDDRDREVAFWEKLGYTAQLEDTPQPSARLRDGAMILSIRQTDDFKSPALAYVARNQAATIARLQQEGLKLSDEHKDSQGRVIDATLTAPDGQAFFLVTGQ